MFDRSRFRTVTSLLAALFLVIATVPTAVQASDPQTPKTSLGSVSGTGKVELRGVFVNQEGTLFEGDRVRTGSMSYAKVILVNGNKVELASDTEFTVNTKEKIVRLEVASGNVAFTASQNPFMIVIGGYELTPRPGSSGNVAVMGQDLAGIHMLTGSAILKDVRNKSVTTLGGGTERLVAMKSGNSVAALPRFASAGPVPMPQAQAGAAAGAAAGGATAGVATGTIVAVVGAVVGAVGTLGALSGGGDEPGDATSPVSKDAALSNLASIASSSTQVSALSSSVMSVGQQAHTAIQNSASPNKALLLQLVDSATASATSANAAAADLQTKIAALQAEIQGSGSVSVTQQQKLQSLISQMVTAINTGNNALTSMNIALNDARAAGITSVPSNPSFQQVAPPTAASGSLPS